MLSTTCPNCRAKMGEGDPCPECEHMDADEGCECAFCEEEYLKHRRDGE